MVSPQPERFAITPSSGRPFSTPGSRSLRSPLTDETIWKRLKEAGFDEESIKRRDKAALIAYIARLEAEIFDHQHHMGLLILERKEWTSKYEQVKASADSAEIQHKLDHAAHLSALAEARKREDSLKKALGVEKECVANIEKALHEMRAESAETKVAAESKLTEAHSMVEDAQKKFTVAEAKLRAAESLQAEANRYHRAAERKLQEVEAREDDLRRRISSFKTDCDAKEKQIILERQSLVERQKTLQQGQERLLDGQALLNQREDYIFSRTQELSQLEKELEASKVNLETEIRALNEEKSNLQLNIASLSAREEAVIKKEAMLNKKEQELLILQEKAASKGSDEVQKLLADHESAMKRRTYEFEAELEMKRKLVEDELETKRRAWELREVDLRHQEELIMDREHDLEVQARALADKEKDMIEKLNSLEEKEKTLNASEKEVELKKIFLQKEQEEINNMKLELQRSLDSLEGKRNQVDRAKENLETMKSETSELLVLETKLKEEIDMVRAQKLELVAGAEELKIEKAKFEAEWESIDEKREELRRELKCVAEERLAISRFLKDERDSLKVERDAMREQYKRDVESLSREREDFMSKMVHERSEWFSKIQQDRADVLLDMEMQKKELEFCFDRRREELESYFREKEKAFEQEKSKELQYISSRKETITKELEHVALEMKRLDAERIEINLDHERRDREWAELNNSIEELKVQRQKLKKQRELLHADREDIHAQIEHLKKLENIKILSDNIAAADIEQSDLYTRQQKLSAKRYLNQQTIIQNGDTDSHRKSDSDSPSPAPFSWIKQCAKLIFKHSPDKLPIKYGERSLISDSDDASLTLAGQLDSSNGFDGEMYMGNEKTRKIFSERQPVRYSLGEPKVILEVPSLVENVKGMHNLESESKKDAGDNYAHSFSEQELLAGRKRRIKSSSSHDIVDTSLEEGPNNKKRKQQKDAIIDLSEQTTTHRVVSTQPDASEDHASMSMNQSQGGSENINVLMIDKIIKISEVTCESTGTDKFAVQDKLDCHQNSPAELDQDVSQDGGTNDHANSSYVGNGMPPGGSEAQGIVQEVFVADVGQIMEHSQSQEDAMAKKNDQKLKGRGVSVSDNDEKLNQVGKRTRSKQKK